MENNRFVRKEEENTIDLLELFMELFGRLHILLLAGIVTALLALIGTKVFITPMYKSTTSVYVLSKQDQNAAVTYTDLQTGTQLTKDYMELVTTRPVLEQVISVLNLDMETEELEKCITVETKEDTRIFSISVVNEDPQVACDMANALREAVGIQIMQVMDADSVNTVEDGNLPKKPDSPSLMKNVALGGMLGMFLAAAFIILIYILDDTIKTPADVEQYLGLNVLASIPVEEGNSSGKRKKKIKKSAKNVKNKRRA